MKKRKPPTIGKMIQSEVSEARRVRAFLNGQDISQTAPLWLAPGIPSHWNAVQLAKQFGITRERVTIHKSAAFWGAQSISAPQKRRNGQILYFAIMICRFGDSTRAGASCSKDESVAIEFAFRNSVRQLIADCRLRIAD